MEISPHPLGITSLRGSNAAQFLQGYVTSDTDALHENKAMPAAFTNLKGRVLANGWIFGTSNNVQLILHRSTIKLIHNHLKKYLVFAQSQFVEEIKPISISTAKESEVGYPTLDPYRWSTSSKEQQPNQDIEYFVSTVLYSPNVIIFYIHNTPYSHKKIDLARKYYLKEIKDLGIY